MQLTRALYRSSTLFFVVFCALVVWGFWLPYYSNPLGISDLLLQVHGLAMTLWCVMLVAQAYLIRTNERSLHRLLGKASYVLAPVNVVLQTVVLWVRVPMLERLFDQSVMSARGFTFVSHSLGTILLFGLLYGLAVLYRRTAPVHARYMLCTALPILAPAMDRIVGLFLMPGVAPYLPQVAARPYGPFVVWLIADITVATLAVWDWRTERRLNVFPLVLTLFVAYQAFTVNAYRIPAWREFCGWFFDVPVA
jgi:hypothetical protein